MISAASIGRQVRAAFSDAPGPWVAVSPNQTEGSQLAHVPGQLRSAEMSQLRLATPGGEDGLGVWVDGAEAVRVVPHGDLHDAARWGLMMRQKAVLHWHPDGAAGHTPEAAVPFRKPAVEYMAEVPLPPSQAVRRFQAHGVNYLTVVPTAVGSRVHVVDGEGALRQSFHAAADGAQVRETPGHATFLGDWDSREKGAAVFHSILRERPARLSRERPAVYVGHHFTSATSAPEVLLDPHHPHNPYTEADYRAWPQRRTFFYLDPTKREGLLLGAKNHYIAHIPAEGIYDADVEGLHSMEHLFSLPKTYKGVKWDNTIQMFHPVLAKLYRTDE